MAQSIPPLEEFIPSDVLEALTLEQIAEINAAYGAIKNVSIPSSFAFLNSPNIGLWYLVLATPMKYSLLKGLSPADNAEAILMDLWTFDQTRFDLYHRMVEVGGSDRANLQHQVFDSSMALLGNKHLSYTNAKVILHRLVELHEDDFSSAEIADIVSYQLLDKWDVEDYPAQTLQAIVEFLETNGAVDHIAKFKRYQRRAEKKIAK